MIKPQLTGFVEVKFQRDSRFLFFQSSLIAKNLLDRDLLVYFFNLYALLPAVITEAEVDRCCQ